MAAVTHSPCPHCIRVHMSEFENDLNIGDIIHRQEYERPIYFEVVDIEGEFYRLCEGHATRNSSVESPVDKPLGRV